MPSFDIVSNIDNHELQNTVDQVQRELGNRFDFRNVDYEVSLQKENVVLAAPADFQVNQIFDILKDKAIKRGIDILCFDPQPMETNLAKAKMTVLVKQGVDKLAAKKIVQMIKNSKMKVQASIQGDQVRVTGKKRDDLQEAIALMKDSDLGLPLQFENFRD